MKNSIIAILILITSNLTYSQDSITVGSIYHIDSDILGEKREIWVGLPANYDSTLTYPTIYVLDAEWQFDIALSVTKELASNGKIPEHIVVGIPKIDEPRRFKDLTFTDTKVSHDGKPDSTIASYFDSEKTGGGNLFFKHLKDEIIPFIARMYKPNGFDVLIGHSLSGYFGAYIMTLESPFEAYQLYDPSFWYNNGDVVNHYIETVKPGFKTNVFITTAQEGGRILFHENLHDSLNTVLSSAGINSKLKIYPNENHGSVRLPSLIDGLSNLYIGYSFGYISPTDTITVADIDKHFESFSEKVNYKFTCPIDIYRWIGFANYSKGNWNAAIEAYSLIFPAYENDIYVLKEVAECYASIEAYQLSLDTYMKAFSLNQTDESVGRKIDELKLLTTKNEQH